MKFLKWLKRNQWETVYLTPVTVTLTKLWGGGDADAIVRIQVEREKNKARALVTSLGYDQEIDIAEVCAYSSEARAICKKENINY